MFQLTKEEYLALRFQFGTLEKGKHSKYLPHAFSEQGVAMLSSVLHSERAVQVNIMIMRAFVRLRQILALNKELAEKVAALEARVGDHDVNIMQLFADIDQILNPPLVEAIGFLRERDG